MGSGELLQEADVVLIEVTDVIDAVHEHGEALEIGHTACVSLGDPRGYRFNGDFPTNSETPTEQSARHALLYNVASALTFPIGGLLAYGFAGHVDVAYRGARR